MYVDYGLWIVDCGLWVVGCGLCMAKLSSLNGEYGYIFLRNTEQKKKLKFWVISTSYLERWKLTMVKPSKLLITIQVLLIQLGLTSPWMLGRLSKRSTATCLEMNANMLKIIMIKHISYIHSK